MSATAPILELPVLTVAELTGSIRRELEARFPVAYVQGEVINFKKHSSGHLYFSLKDDEATIAAVMFAGQTSQLARLPTSGDQVIVRAKLSVYPARGNYQLYVKELHFVGLGELLAKFQALKEQLRSFGWLDADKKKSLPLLPKRIGVITSPTGAVIQDIIHVLQRRFRNFELILNPVKVQGEGAAEEIAEAIQFMNRHQLCDVLIVGRGGGSLEDLWAFNELVVATAIHESHIPIVSAVGHETDITIADFVADVRAPTPSAAAEMVVASREELEERLLICRQRLQHVCRQIISRRRQQLRSLLRHPAISAPDLWLHRRRQKLEDVLEELDAVQLRMLRSRRRDLVSKAQHLASLSPTRRYAEVRLRLGVVEVAVRQSWQRKQRQFRDRLLLLGATLDEMQQRKIDRSRIALEGVAKQLTLINPLHLLQRGFALVTDAAMGKVLKDAQACHLGQELMVRLGRGTLRVAVLEVHTSDEQRP